MRLNKHKKENQYNLFVFWSKNNEIQIIIVRLTKTNKQRRKKIIREIRQKKKYNHRLSTQTMILKNIKLVWSTLANEVF